MSSNINHRGLEAVAQLLQESSDTLSIEEARVAAGVVLSTYFAASSEDLVAQARRRG